MSNDSTNPFKPGSLLRIKWPDELWPSEALFENRPLHMLADGVTFYSSLEILKRRTDATFSARDQQMPFGTIGLLAIDHHSDLVDTYQQVLWEEKTIWLSLYFLAAMLGKKAERIS